MSSPLTEAVAFLTRARDLLLGQSQSAGGQGNWATAKSLIDLAERADRLREEIPALRMSREGHRPKEESEQESTAAEDGATDQTTAQNGYPKYFVRGNNLVKRGLQRSGQDVYEHAVPQDWYEQIFDRLVQMTKAPGKQHPFSIDQVQKGMDCPRYMTYVVVSLLLRVGLIVRARKGSYTFAQPTRFAGQAGALWEQLKQRENS